MEYIYIENDNAWFRMRAGTGLTCVDEVWTPDGWKLYEGDRGKPYLEGMQVKESDVPPFRKPVAPPRRIGIDRTAEWAGKSFQIISAPAKSKLR
jgi:hypothetical protein